MSSSSSSSSSSGVVIRRPRKRARRVVEEESSPPPPSSDDEVDEEMEASSDEEMNGEAREPLKSILDLDTLPENGMEHILRHLSRVPRAKTWTKYINVKDLGALYDLGGDFGAYVHSRFDTLSVGEMREVSTDEFLWKELKSETVWMDDSIYAAHDLLSKAGLNFRSLLFPGDSMLPSILYDIADACINVRSVGVGDEGGELVEAFGGRLEALHLGRHPCIREVADNCVQLRELTLDTVELRDLERSDLWKKLGDTLQSIRAVFYFTGEVELRKIRKYCRKLKTVHIETAIRSEASDSSEDDDAVRAGFNAELVLCLASYGTQLEYASLANMDAVQLRTVASACTEAKLDVRFKEEECIYEQLEILGKRLQIAHLSMQGKSVKHEFIADGWKSCVNLKEVEIIYPTLSGIMDLFGTPKPLLEEISLMFEATYEDDGSIFDVKEVMDCIARRCTSLEKVVVHAVKPQAEYFKSLVYKNKSLKSLTVDFLYDFDRVDDGEEGPLFYSVSELISIFLKSSTLEEMAFSNSGGSFFEPGDDLRKKIVERGIQIMFNDVAFLGATESWTTLLHEEAFPPHEFHEFAGGLHLAQMFEDEYEEEDDDENENE